MKRRLFVAMAVFFACTCGLWAAKDQPSTLTTRTKKSPMTLGQKLALSPDTKASELLLKEALKASKDSPILNFRLSELYLELGDIASWRSSFAKVIGSPLFLNTALMDSLISKLPEEEQKIFAPLLIKHGILKEKPTSVCPFFELDQRKKRGELLMKMAEALTSDRPSLIKIWRELFIKLPETNDAQVLSAQTGFSTWQSEVSLS
ncbi:MAG TPA: hypothetical protein VEK06_03360, partial [Myxococcota bacterium]|nr:hypothetical protein [Myxococcota bacterium]